MKRIVLLFVSVFALVAYGENDDSLCVMANQNQCRLDSIMNSVSVLQQQLLKHDKMFSDVEQQRRDFEALRDSNRFQQIRIDDFQQEMADLEETLLYKDSVMSALTQQMSHHLYQKDKQLGKLLILVLIVAMCLIVFTFLARRMVKKKEEHIRVLCARQDELRINQEKLQEDNYKTIQSIAQLVDFQINNNIPRQTDHSLALKVADELVRIEANLARMDSSIKGYRQLLRAVERIKSNFLANGYEIVDMLGEPYHEGMKVVANFITDETLERNQQRITGIIKPQINYNGTMIQSAQITVSQNL